MPLENDERPLPYVGDTLTIWFPGGSPYGVGGEVTQVTGSLVTLDHTDTYDLELATDWRVRPRPKPGWTYCPRCGMDVPDPIFDDFCRPEVSG